MIEEVARFGREFHHGFEAGSKAELIAAIGNMTDPDACLVCNGYKDEEFIDLGLYATKLGIKCILVVEMPGEVPVIVERSKALGIRPNIGLRMKLSTRAGGQWTDSGGDRSVFGLNTAELITIVDQIRDAGMPEASALSYRVADSEYP